MNEIKKIHLDRQPFTISVEAHRELRAYLDAIERQVGPRGHDVLKEIELRMAELLTERGVTTDKVVLPEDVEFLKDQLGKPGDFKDEADEARNHGSDGKNAASDGSSPQEADEARGNDSEYSGQPKRLYRDMENAELAGVAAGLAAYLRVDPLIIRLIFILLVFTGGAGIITYILLWILVPEAKTPSERLQMRGKAVTVDNIKRLVDRADLPAAAARVNRTSATIAKSLGNVLRMLIGIFVVVLGTATFTGIMVAGAYLFVHGATVNDVVVFPVGLKEGVGVVSAGIAGIIVSLAFIVIGNTIIRKKWTMPGWVTAIGAAFFITASAIALAIGLNTAPKIDERRNKVQGPNITSDAPFDMPTNYEDLKDLRIELR